MPEISDTVSVTEQAMTPKPRHSTRQVNCPTYLNDYVPIADTECEMLCLILNDEPINYQEASRDKCWRDACSDEIDSINQNETWVLVEKPPGVKIIELKWIFKIK